MEVKIASVYEIDKEDWRQKPIYYLEYKKLSMSHCIKQKSKGKLQAFSTIRGLYTIILSLISCFNAWMMRKGKTNDKEAHPSICGHISQGAKLHDCFKRMGY